MEGIDIQNELRYDVLQEKKQNQECFGMKFRIDFIITPGPSVDGAKTEATNTNTTCVRQDDERMGLHSEREPLFCWFFKIRYTIAFCLSFDGNAT